MATKKDEKYNTWWAVGLAWQLGYTIAIPLVIFALLGRFVDQYFNSSPIFLLLGIFISIMASSWLVYKKVTKLLS